MGKFEIVQNNFCASIPALKTSFALNLNEICPIDFALVLGPHNDKYNNKPHKRQTFL